MTKFQKFLQGFVLGFGILLVNPSLVNPPDPPKALRWSSKDFNCLVEAVWYESRNQPIEGQIAVLEVIHNRKNSKGFPDSYCSVIHSRYAFSYRGDAKQDEMFHIRPKNKQEYNELLKIRNRVYSFLSGEYPTSLDITTRWYSKVDIKRSWMSQMKVDVIIADHKFLKKE